jgi:hypothetical protein
MIAHRLVSLESVMRENFTLSGKIQIESEIEPKYGAILNLGHNQL